MKYDTLLNKLDIQGFIDSFFTYFSREGNLFLQIQNQQALDLINSLSVIDFKACKKTVDIIDFLAYLKKGANLKSYEIYEFVKIVEYFKYMKTLKVDNNLKLWLNKIEIPQMALDLIDMFDKKGNLNQDKFEDLLAVVKKIESQKKDLKSKLQNILHSRSLQEILVDKQIHYRNEIETILVRSGFANYIKAKVVDRSSAGYFYISPKQVEYINSELNELENIKEETIYKIEKQISESLRELGLFFKFLNNEFNKLDSLQARVFFSKSSDYEFVMSTNTKSFVISSFYHPAINNAKATSIEFDKDSMFITGVNAGGKSMLLKSILVCSFCAKYLIPMNIDAKNSFIPSFSSIDLVLDDPQNVKNDISTFAGRMVEFKSLLTKKNTLIGVDEIELGTDANEAAALFKILIDKLVANGNKVVVTTHHKRLASMFASGNSNLVAAIYDEKKQLPTYEFLSGTIGRSYAFETASRYGIDKSLVQQAKSLYSDDSENLDDLIQQNIDLEYRLKQKQTELTKELEKVKSIKHSLGEQKHEHKKRTRKKINELTREFEDATNEAKKALKMGSQKDIHKQLNIANKKYQNIQKEELKEKTSFKKGDMVKFKDKVGEILQLKENWAKVEFESMTISINLIDITKSYAKKISKTRGVVTFERPTSGATSKLDIHGLRAQEAQEKIERFINIAILNNLNEVVICHGVGSGVLASITHEYLGGCRQVKDFRYDKTGLGTTLVKF